MRSDLLHLASDLVRRAEPFALATVVRREAPSSARVGDAALVTQGGAFHGWLGGSGTQPVVVREALRALADGTPRLIALSPDPAHIGLVASRRRNMQGGSFMDYLVPTAMETPKWEVDKTVTPSPHHPLGAKGVGESATVGAPPAIANAVVDALAHLGVRRIDIPITPEKVWTILKEKGVAE